MAAPVLSNLKKDRCEDVVTKVAQSRFRHQSDCGRPSCPQAWGGLIKQSALHRHWRGALYSLFAMHVQGFKPNTVAWNLATAACGRCQKWQATLRLMTTASQAADQITYNTAAKLTCEVGRWEVGHRCIAGASERRIEPDAASSWSMCLHEFAVLESCDATACTSALSALCSELQWQAGMNLLEEFFCQALEADVAMVGTGIAAISASDRWHCSLNLFSLLHSRTLRADSICLGACANGFVQRANWFQAVHLGTLLMAEDLQLNRVFCNSVLGGFQKCGRWESLGVMLRNAGGGPDLVAMNTAVAACEKGSIWQQATLLLEEAKVLDIQPDAIFGSAVLTACQDAASWQLQLQHFWGFCGEGCHEPRAALCNSVLSAGVAWQPALHIIGQLCLWRLRPAAVACGASLRCFSAEGGRWRDGIELLDTLLADWIWWSSTMKQNQVWCSVLRVPGISWKASLDILHTMRVHIAEADATLLATVVEACDKASQSKGKLQPLLADVAREAVLGACFDCGVDGSRDSRMKKKTDMRPNTPIPKTGKYVKPHLKEVYKFFRDEWVNCNVFRSPGPMQLDSSGDVGPLSERPITLLADYFSVDELKQIVQPSAQPAPLIMCKEPLVVRDVRLRENLSFLEQERLNYEPALPGYLRDRVTWQEDELAPHSCDNIEELVQSFPLMHAQVCAIRLVPPIAVEGDEVDTMVSERSPTSMRHTAVTSDYGKPMTVGIVFASSQVPGYHPVIAGLFDYLAGLNQETKLIGFFCGYEGLLKDLWAPVTKDMVDQFRNLGGQDLLCQFGDPSTLAFKDHLQAAIETISRHKLDGLVLVGNEANQVDSAFLAEACAASRLSTRVIGVPVSLDCNFPFVQQTIGFDTVTRTLSAFIGTIGNLVKTSRNMWIFVRTMGDAWSHVAVQIALQTHVHMVLLSGSQLLGQYLVNIVSCLCDLIVKRHDAGEDYGIIMLPVGFVNDILELRILFAELMEVMSKDHYEQSWESIPKIAARLKPATAALFDVIPRDVQFEICFGGRERYMNKIDFSTISTDRLLLRFVEMELLRRRQLGHISKDFFNGMCYPMAYQARSAMPTNFDCDLAYTLGWSAGIMVNLEKTGQLVHVSHLEKDVSEWRVRGLPLTCLLRTEFEEETQEYRILPAYVHLLKQRNVRRPFVDLPPPKNRTIQTLGPVQYTRDTPELRTTWYMENQPIQDPTEALRETAYLCSELHSTMALAKAESTLYAVNSLLDNAVSVLDAYKRLHDSKKRGQQSLAEVPMEHLAKVWTTKHMDRSDHQGLEHRTHHSTRGEVLTKNTDLVLA
ncbi:PFP-BETA1 [Symbiodinium natans]|uniref:PFP-BETA1 protein n=1 Tax=Symbiodinium natans TaxID=878477 RepID=A0A812GI20_9DINO|nr:PFP-BETA1 [Symbiodinium natans]